MRRRKEREREGVQSRVREVKKDCPIGKKEVDRSKCDFGPLIKFNRWFKKNNTITIQIVFSFLYRYYKNYLTLNNLIA